jgi:transcriptional regulator with XRE-family HTH domain
MKEIARNIKNAREKHNFTQEYMAAELEISQPAYSKIEAAKTEITFLQLVKISRIFKVDVMELIMENPAPTSYEQLEGRVKKLEQELTDLKRMLKTVRVETN